MAAITRFTAAVSVLSLLSVVNTSPLVSSHYYAIRNESSPSASTAPSHPGPKPVIQQYSAPADFSYPGVTFPTFGPNSLNPNGPFYNPNDFIPFYAEWPGRPSEGQKDPPPMPTEAPKPVGGNSAEEYKAPAWQEKGRDLSPGLSQDETNGDSQWGLIDAPRLGGPGHGGPGHGGPGNGGPGNGGPGNGGPGNGGNGGGPTRSRSSSTRRPSNTGSPSQSNIGQNSTSKVSTPSASGSTSGASSSFGSPTISSFVSSITSSASSLSSVSSRPGNTTSACSASSDTSSICSATIPETGATRTYDFSVAYGTVAPDGVQKNGLLINNQFPGPLIEANWGDWIEVHVKNNLPENSTDQGEGTALHWHGFLQQETPYYDGVPSVQQCPIAPSKSLTYKFRADHVGTSWYHSHYSAQYAGGALGPIVIHGPTPPGACYDEDLGPVMVGDWYHADYYSLVEVTMAGQLALSDNILINGKMNYPCENTTAVCTPNAGISKFQFTPGNKYRMRLINPSGEATIKFHIDNHNLTVIANDFVPIKPYTTNVVTLGVGQRSDIIVEATGNAGDAFWMRATAGNFLGGAGCSLTSGVVTEGVAAVYYDGADTNAEPTTESSLTDEQLARCENDDLSLTQSLCPVALDDDADVASEEILIEFKSNGTNFVWFMNNSSFRADYNFNLLDEVVEKNYTFKPEWNVHSFDQSKTSIRLIVENAFALPHPMHLHGHDFNVLAEGVGTWDGTIINPENTQVRDVHQVPGSSGGLNGFMVLQFKTDNPGIWPFHCHIAWHVSGGLYINVLEQQDSIRYQVPADVDRTCGEWAAWQALGNIPNQIDSGL